MVILFMVCIFLQNDNFKKNQKVSALTINLGRFNLFLKCEKASEKSYENNFPPWLNQIFFKKLSKYHFLLFYETTSMVL